MSQLDDGQRRRQGAAHDEFEGELSPHESAAPGVRSVIQYAFRLANVALDYHQAGVEQDLAEIGSCADVAGTLGREWTGMADDIPRAERMSAIGNTGDIFTRAMAHVVRASGDDPTLAGFLSAAFMTWAIFYDKVEIDFPEPP